MMYQTKGNIHTLNAALRSVLGDPLETILLLLPHRYRETTLPLIWIMCQRKRNVRTLI
jgi:Arc/MetJ family transcription regulator